jgi:hypothetical protein
MLSKIDSLKKGISKLGSSVLPRESLPEEKMKLIIDTKHSLTDIRKKLECRQTAILKSKHLGPELAELFPRPKLAIINAFCVVAGNFNQSRFSSSSTSSLPFWFSPV